MGKPQLLVLPDVRYRRASVLVAVVRQDAVDAVADNDDRRSPPTDRSDSKQCVSSGFPATSTSPFGLSAVSGRTASLRRSEHDAVEFGPIRAGSAVDDSFCRRPETSISPLNSVIPASLRISFHRLNETFVGSDVR